MANTQFSPNKSPARFQTNNNLMMNFNTFDIEDEEWLPGAVKCKEKKHSKVVNGMKIVKVTRVFLMQNGETEVVENTLKELL
jgi:hypothetical protein